MTYNNRLWLQIACLAAFALLVVRCGDAPAEPTATASATASHRGGQQRGYPFKAKVVSSKGVARTVSQGYLLFLPQGYDASPGKKWPLILYLHGVDLRGNSLGRLTMHGLPRLVEERPDFLPFIVVSPQCPDDVWGEDILWWHLTDSLGSLLDEVVATYPVDPDRIYLTGFSMGGYGTWLLASLYPERFAAIAPVSGGNDADTKICALKGVPVWAFHGDQDRVVPFEEAKTMVDTLKACGGDVRFTVYSGIGHLDAGMRTFENPELYSWFLQHTRSDGSEKPRP